MHMFYMDESMDEQTCVLSALSVPVQRWHETFAQIREFRRSLRRDYGIYVRKELHAWKFVSGRGRPSDRIIGKSERAKIFRQALNPITELPETRLFNAVANRKQYEKTFEWLLNRINRTLRAWDSYGLVICDEGKEDALTRLVRRMYVYNPIPSRYGVWFDCDDTGGWTSTGQGWKNIPLDRIVEDPWFKSSTQSYFIQLADFAAYSLLRRESPVPSKTKYGLDRAFEILGPVLFREASRSDPEGIIRP